MMPKILWGALFLSNFTICYIYFFDFAGFKELEDSTDMGLLAYAPHLIACVGGLISFLISRSVKKSRELKSNNSDLDKAKQLTKMILAWAFAESVNIFGMIGPLLGMPRDHYYLFFAAAIALMLTSYPKDNKALF